MNEGILTNFEKYNYKYNDKETSCRKRVTEVGRR